MTRHPAGAAGAGRAAGRRHAPPALHLPGEENELSRRYLRLLEILDSLRRDAVRPLAGAPRLRALPGGLPLVRGGDRRPGADLRPRRGVAGVRRSPPPASRGRPCAGWPCRACATSASPTTPVRRVRPPRGGPGPAGELRHQVGRAREGLLPREPVWPHGGHPGPDLPPAAGAGGAGRRRDLGDGGPAARGLRRALRRAAAAQRGVPGHPDGGELLDGARPERRLALPLP